MKLRFNKILSWLSGWFLAALIIILLVFGFAKLSSKANAQDTILDCFGNEAPSDWIGDGFCDDGSYTWNGTPIRS